MLEPLDPEVLATVSGGMKWENFRRSTNIEDRRGPKAVARDTAWWNSTHPATGAAK
jgi:hypothetical protein